jgi:hypothetical protein
MPFEISKIDYEKYSAINKHDIWTEAMQIYMHGDFDYWVDVAEEKELQTYKENFAVEFTEEGLLKQFFRPYINGLDWMESPKEGRPAAGGKQGTYLTATEILAEMMEKAGVFRNLSDKKLGGLLKKNGFEKKSRWRGGNPVKAYQVIRLTDKDQISEDDQLEKAVTPPQVDNIGGMDIEEEPDPFV